MRMNPRARILVSLGVGLCMVGAAFFATSNRSQTVDAPVAVVAGPAPERTLLAVADDDADGTADWKQTLPAAPAYVERPGDGGAGTTTETHTGKLATFILENLVREGDATAYRMATDDVIERSESYILALATDELFKRDDITTALDIRGEAALRAYGNRVAQITVDNSLPRPVENELLLLERALDTQDPSLLADLKLKEASYAGMVDDMLAMRVPLSYAQAHLDLTNAYYAMQVNLGAFQQFFTDPLYTAIRLERYDEDALGVYQAFMNLYTQLYEDGITTWTDADAASQLIGTN